MIIRNKKQVKICPKCGSIMKTIQRTDFVHIHLYTNYPKCPNSKQ